MVQSLEQEQDVRMEDYDVCLQKIAKNNGIMMDLASKLLYENLYDKLIVIKDNI